MLIRRHRAALIVATVAIHVSGFSQVLSAQADAGPPFPPSGQLIDIGGWRLHLYCTGEAAVSQPTVILEAGLGDFSVEWSLVQPRVATFARVCSYDRAGHGWSEVGPNPRTFSQIVYELHTLLEKGAVSPPYVLVGHSYGGWLVRQYASTYPTDVAGMVLVEGGFDDPWRLTPNGLVRATALARSRPIPRVQTANPLRESDIPPAALGQMKAAGEAAAPRANEPPRDKLPKEAQQMRAWGLSRWQHYAAAVNPVEPEELAAMRAERLARPALLGDMPLAVVTRGISDESGPDGKEFEDERKKEHAELAAMSRSGKQLIAARSGHHIQIDEPELVITTIREVLQAARPR